MSVEKKEVPKRTYELLSSILKYIEKSEIDFQQQSQPKAGFELSQRKEV